MHIHLLKEIFHRDLQKLKLEIDSYRDEEKIWHVEKNIANSGGNLCLHLVGNLNTYIGKELGNRIYERNRDEEFSQKGVSKEDLIKKINATVEVVDTALSHMSESQLKEEFPVKVFPQKTTVAFMLLHLSTHLSYHLGQINYHRRLLDNISFN